MMTTERRYVKHCSTDVLDRKRPASQFLGYRRSNPLPQRVKTTRRTWSGRSPERNTNLNALSNKDSLHNQTLKDQLQTLPPINREESAVAKKQRPSKRARERMRKKLEKLQLEGKGQQESSLISSESGYDTVWDHPPSASTTTSVSSPERPSRGAMDNSLTDKDNHQITSTAVSATEAHKARIHSRSDSASSANSLNTADISLKKLLKDLHRCDVSITRYQAMLTEHCERGQQRLVQVFNSLRHDLNTREEDLIQELTTTQQTSGTILQRRKDTASFLRQAAEKANTMEETQVTELKQQIKQFVTDRKVDEEIGTMSRFQADPDDLLPHIMGFGKVLNVRHLYTSWEENPGEQIERSKDASCFPPISPLLTSHANESASDKSGSQESICNKSDSDSAFVETLDEVQPESSADCQQPCAVNREEESNAIEESTSTHTIATHTTMEMEGDRLEPTKTPESIQTLDSIHKDNLHTATLPKLPNKIGLAITKLPPLPHNSTPSQIQRSLRSTREKPHRVHPKFMKYKSAKLTAPFKPEQNPISLPADDMSSSKLLTGSPIITTGRTTKWREDKYGSHEKVEELPETDPVTSCHEVIHSPEELVVIQSRVRDSLRQQGVYLYDPFTGACPESLQELRDTESAEFLPRKKKTPTQLRRERKKRQKERERRQQELERRGRGEVEVKEALETPHDGSSNLNTETCTGKSSNDSSSDSFNHPPQTESSTTSGEQRKKKKKSKTKSKGLKDEGMENENQLTESESYALSSDSENGSQSSETQSSSPPPERVNENSAVNCAHIKSENGCQNGDQDQTIVESRTTKSPQTTIIHDTDKSESVQQELVSGTPNDGRNETTGEHREESDTSLEPQEVQAEAHGSPGDCSTEQTAGGRELQQNISEPTMTTSEDSAADLVTGGKLNTVNQDSTNCSATNEIAVVEEDLPSLANSSCKDIPAETESIKGSESIQPADPVSETQEVRSENATLDGGNCSEEKNEGIEVSRDDASPQVAVGTEAVENQELVTTLNPSSQEPEIVETVEERVPVAEEMESELPSAVKQASGCINTLASSPQASTDCEVTQPDTRDSKTDTEEATQPENEDNKTGVNCSKEATLPENEDNKTGVNYSKEATQPDNNGSDDSQKNQDSDMHGKGLEPNSAAQAKSRTEICRKEPEASETETQAKPSNIELESNAGDIERESSDQIRSSSVTPETDEQLSAQDKLNPECFQSENVPETSAESKQHEE